MLNDSVNILFYSQQLAASAILDNYRREVLLCLFQVFTFYLYFKYICLELLLLKKIFLELLLLKYKIKILVTALCCSTALNK